MLDIDCKENGRQCDLPSTVSKRVSAFDIAPSSSPLSLSLAGDIGIPHDVIEKAYGRPPRPHAVSEIATLPTPNSMVELLRDGWLRA